MQQTYTLHTPATEFFKFGKQIFDPPQLDVHDHGQKKNAVKAPKGIILNA